MPDQTRYYRTPTGGLLEITDSGTAVSEPPEGSTELTAAEYEVALAELQQAQADHLQALRDAERARAQAQYDGLVAAGVSPDVARSIAGLDRFEEPEGQS